MPLAAVNQKHDKCSRCSVAACLRYGEIFSDDFVINLEASLAAKECKTKHLDGAYLHQCTSYQCRYTDPWSRLLPEFICSLAHCQPSLKISCKSVRKFLHKVANRQTNNDDYITFLAEVKICLHLTTLWAGVYRHVFDLCWPRVFCTSLSVVSVVQCHIPYDVLLLDMFTTVVASVIHCRSVFFHFHRHTVDISVRATVAPFATCYI